MNKHLTNTHNNGDNIECQNHDWWLKGQSGKRIELCSLRKVNNLKKRDISDYNSFFVKLQGMRKDHVKLILSWQWLLCLHCYPIDANNILQLVIVCQNAQTIFWKTSLLVTLIRISSVTSCMVSIQLFNYFKISNGHIITFHGIYLQREFDWIITYTISQIDFFDNKVKASVIFDILNSILIMKQ